MRAARRSGPGARRRDGFGAASAAAAQTDRHHRRHGLPGERARRSRTAPCSSGTARIAAVGATWRSPPAPRGSTRPASGSRRASSTPATTLGLVESASAPTPTTPRANGERAVAGVVPSLGRPQSGQRAVGPARERRRDHRGRWRRRRASSPARPRSWTWSRAAGEACAQGTGRRCSVSWSAHDGAGRRRAGRARRRAVASCSATRRRYVADKPAYDAGSSRALRAAACRPRGDDPGRDGTICRSSWPWIGRPTSRPRWTSRGSSICSW